MSIFLIKSDRFSLWLRVYVADFAFINRVRPCATEGGKMETVMRQTWAFVFRGYHLTRRYLSWVIVFDFYALVTSATVALIGVAGHDTQLTLILVVGALLWNFLSSLYNEIAMSIAYERWEGSLEYTFMAPVSRLVYLCSISLFSLLRRAVDRTI